jgi:hypothetical protein
VPVAGRAFPNPPASQHNVLGQRADAPCRCRVAITRHPRVAGFVLAHG